MDAAKHMHRSIMNDWSSEKLELTSIDSAVRRFFIRANGTAADAAKLEAIFGKGEVVTVDGLEGEFGFVTAEMSEADFRAKAEQTDMIRNRIRIEA